MAGKKKVVRNGYLGLIGADVEVRTVGGGLYRGRLVAADASYLYIARHTTGREAVVPQSAVTVVFDEERLANRRRTANLKSE